MNSSRVYDAADRAYSGSAWRHLSPRRDPRSGEGARIGGGRFNPPSSFPVMYLCLTRSCAAAELRRLADRQVVGLAGLLPRRLVRFDVQLTSVLDLTDEAVRDHIEVQLTDLVDDDRTICRAIGVAARARGVQGVVSFSATGVDTQLALFSENLGAGRLELFDKELWSSPDDLESLK